MVPRVRHLELEGHLDQSMVVEVGLQTSVLVYRSRLGYRTLTKKVEY